MLVNIFVRNFCTTINVFSGGVKTSSEKVSIIQYRFLHSHSESPLSLWDSDDVSKTFCAVGQLECCCNACHRPLVLIK